jgi:hypothetical protein
MRGCPAAEPEPATAMGRRMGMGQVSGPRVIVGVLVAAVISACAGGVAGHGPPRLPALSVAADRPDGAAAMYPQPGLVVYQAGASLPALAAQASVYRMAGVTSAARVARLAAALGMTGSVATDPAGWSVTGASSTLRVLRLGGLPWTLASTTASGTAVSGCAIAGPAATTGPGSTATAVSASAGPPASPPPSLPGTPATSTVPAGPPPSCPPPTTVPGLPSAAEAASLAQAALSRAGLDLAGASVQTYGGFTEWEVTISPAVSGVAVVASAWSLSVGANGAILAGSGYLADPASVGDYPLVGVAAGVRRLQQGGPWIVYGGPGPVPMMGAAAANGSGAESGTPSVGGAGSAATPACPPGANCAVPASPPPTSSCPADSSCPAVSQPPATIRTITGVHLALGWWPAADPAIQEAWLLPVYVFDLDNGQTISVLAVSDRYLTQPAPATATTGTPASGPTATPSVVPPAAPAPPGPSATPGLVAAWPRTSPAS